MTCGKKSVETHSHHYFHDIHSGGRGIGVHGQLKVSLAKRSKTIGPSRGLVFWCFYPFA